MDKQQRILASQYNEDLKLKGFRVYKTDNNTDGHVYSRKDFYKISITTGRFIFNYTDRTIETGDNFLFFGNPRIPYSCEAMSPSYLAYSCLFTEDFLNLNERSVSLQQSPLFKTGGTPIFNLNTEQKAIFTNLMTKMTDEQDTAYPFKDELIRNYINLIIHEAMKMQPYPNSEQETNAAIRITTVFFQLMERQFPIESINRPLKLRTAKDYARQLSIHVNHLNSSVKEVTGKPTSTHVAERIISEAKALLQHTDWSIAEIAYSLGFEYPTYFNNFFKKRTGMVPTSVRAAHL